MKRLIPLLLLLTLAQAPTPAHASLRKLCNQFLVRLKIAPSYVHRQADTFVLPHLPLARREKFVVSGQLWSKRKTAEIVADHLDGFDAQFEALGYRIPPFTKIIINDRPLFWTRGPQAIIVPRFHAEHLRFGYTIAMSPLGREKHIITNPHTIAHERAHTLLFENYDSKSLLNSREIFQEAFADFLASHLTGSPYVSGSLFFYRDIEKLEWDSGRIDRWDSPQIESHYDGSLLISNLLWMLRERIGAPHMSAILRSLTDALNAYPMPNHDFEENPKLKLKSSLYFMMGVTEKVLRDTYPELHAESVVTDFAKKVKVDLEDYRKFADRITNPGPVQVRQHHSQRLIFLGHLGGAGSIYLEYLIAKHMLGIIHTVGEIVFLLLP